MIAKNGSVVIAVEGQRGDEGRRHWFGLVVASQGLDFLAKRLVLILGMRLLLFRPVDEMTNRYVFARLMA